MALGLDRRGGQRRSPGPRPPPPPVQYECGECGKSFSLVVPLCCTTSARTRAQRPYKCPDCPKASAPAAAPTTSGATRVSRLTSAPTAPRPSSAVAAADPPQRAHGPARFTCGQCGLAFKWSSTHQYHLRQHTGERPYPCPDCPKAFKNSGPACGATGTCTRASGPHLRACAAKVTQSTNLRHQRVHTGEEALPLPALPQDLHAPSNLLLHQRTHGGAAAAPVLRGRPRASAARARRASGKVLVSDAGLQRPLPPPSPPAPAATRARPWCPSFPGRGRDHGGSWCTLRRLRAWLWQRGAAPGAPAAPRARGAAPGRPPRPLRGRPRPAPPPPPRSPRSQPAPPPRCPWLRPGLPCGKSFRTVAGLSRHLVHSDGAAGGQASAAQPDGAFRSWPACWHISRATWRRPRRAPRPQAEAAEVTCPQEPLGPAPGPAPAPARLGGATLQVCRVAQGLQGLFGAALPPAGPHGRAALPVRRVRQGLQALIAARHPPAQVAITGPARFHLGASAASPSSGPRTTSTTCGYTGERGPTLRRER